MAVDFDKLLFWEKYVQDISHRIAVKIPFMENTTITKNIAAKLETTEEGVHSALIGIATQLTPGMFKLVFTPFMVVEMIKAYRKDGRDGVKEALKWYLISSTAGITLRKGPVGLIETIGKIIAGN